MAKVLVEVPFHGCYMQKMRLSYFIKRFDRYGKEAAATEDFAQLTGNTRDKNIVLRWKS
jgi:hypothetical protein